ncbi:MAG TPA: DUF89 family protein [Candidatus Blautia gallistercoris]|uniref:DUF89 family protein n=1 Tax=Candidatus Blautia gallistercoris TaxID=2838490 RepID=A0A9D2B4B9_9FIRM|nr:DUF89 family protein [Candidatus Blautia gallistercoris]
MKVNTQCLTCLVQMQENQVRAFDDEEKKVRYMREILEFLGTCNPELSAPALVLPLSRIYEKYWGKSDPDSAVNRIKQEFNDYLLSMEQDLEREIRGHEDTLEAALTYARTGNYIDYASVKDLSREKLLALLEEQAEGGLDAEEYALFTAELKEAKRLVYLTDNCGEIVLDKIALKLLKEQYPALDIQVIVRGAPVVNDADVASAEYVGLDKIVPVMGNGSTVAGTDLSDVSAEAEEMLRSADLIISKGQGNFETLHGCGLNIYYLFLCKCDWFMEKFQAEKFQGMFVNERRISF